MSSQAAPFFTVGITGHMNLPEGSEAILKEKVREVLRWLKSGRVKGCKEFGEPLGLKETQIVLISPLAPGADQLAVEVALEEGIPVKCPMPFPAHIYREATTFTGIPELTANRQKQFDALLQKIGPENAFPVRHYDDQVPITRDEDWDIKDEEFRNLRYRATGEFVSAHCDLLIAICNQKERKDLPDQDTTLSSRSHSGSRRITASYINGLRPGILPIPPSLAWQDNGPLVRIYCPNKDAGADALATGHIAIWHSEDASLHGGGKQVNHEVEMKKLRELARRLERLNSDLKKVTPRPANVEKMPTPEEGCGENSKVRRLLLFVDRVEQLAARNNKVAKVLTNLSYVVGFLVFLCLAFVQIGWYIYLAVAAALFTGAMVVRWLIRNEFNTFQKREDYRAITEGMRVQAYWSFAGIRQSVADNYMQRLRGDLAWIRSAIDSLIFPCDEIAVEYDSISTHGGKLKRFQDVLKYWVINQEKYFSKGVYRKSRTREVLSFLSIVSIAASASLMLVSVLVQSNFRGLRNEVVWVLREYGLNSGFEWGMIGLGIVAFFLVSNYRFSRSFEVRNQRMKLGYDMTVFGIFKHWSFRIAIGLVLGFLAYAWIYHETAPNFAAARDKYHDQVTSFAKAILLALAGLWVSYSNTIFAKEDAKRYADMRGQFGAARRKISFILREYEQMIIKDADLAELDTMEKGIQQLFLALGREALHEQTEWLLMRRNRPVEPVASVR